MNLLASSHTLKRAEEIPRDPFTNQIYALQQRVSALESALHESTESHKKEVSFHQEQIAELKAENEKHKKAIVRLSTTLYPTISLLTAQAELQQGVNTQVQTSLKMLSSAMNESVQKS